MNHLVLGGGGGIRPLVEPLKKTLFFCLSSVLEGNCQKTKLGSYYILAFPRIPSIRCRYSPQLFDLMYMCLYAHTSANLQTIFFLG